jgi:hypothetical protein
MKCMFATVNVYMSRRNALSPVQRQMSATALGNFAVSSVLPGSSSAPKKTVPSDTTSWTTLPVVPFSFRLTSRRARMWSSMGSNWPRATEANAVYSPSVENSHG